MTVRKSSEYCRIFRAFRGASPIAGSLSGSTLPEALNRISYHGFYLCGPAHVGGKVAYLDITGLRQFGAKSCDFLLICESIQTQGATTPRVIPRPIPEVEPVTGVRLPRNVSVGNVMSVLPVLNQPSRGQEAEKGGKKVKAGASQNRIAECVVAEADLKGIGQGADGVGTQADAKQVVDE